MVLRRGARSRLTMAYDAFISYSQQADRRIAEALQNALHRIAKPWNRMRTLRVFRDASSLAAGTRRSP